MTRSPIVFAGHSNVFRVDAKAVANALGITEAEWHRLIRSRQAPHGVMVDGVRFWTVGAVREFVRARAAG